MGGEEKIGSSRDSGTTGATAPDGAASKYVSPNGYSDDYGPNVALILKHGSRVIRGRVPAQVRAELREAVRDGVLGHLPKDGLKPEVFFHPAHRGSATEVRQREAAYAVECIRGVIDHPLARP